ncbi:MAG: sensor histidine kinase [Planctomycetaceae bacterium]|nr:sensor histidine kinase [Planctomycetaceae bacterium]
MQDPRTDSRAGAQLENRIGTTLRELAHEFGNLLFPLQMILELQAHAAPLSPDELGRILRGHIDELGVLTTRFRWVGRCLGGRMETHCTAIPCADLVQSALEACRFPRTGGHAIRIDLDAAPDTIHADRELLQQALAELVDNAIRFTPAGTGIRIAVARQGDGVEFVVSDSGPGIAPELRSQVFEPFISGSSRLDIAAGQLGCGLAIVRRIADIHSGTAELRSSAAAGSQFAVRIPVEA